ncbi:hypothetical protein WH96_00765 [Kiloniella spongiae]|uniref:Energy transducer TonB n=2 Tax=Kiloniella spongiae TaxID=1489064 RepID=A0A0H2N141_9PROT|nr:hypothetical protein WH96_00765 [Kiloniella spongiae]
MHMALLAFVIFGLPRFNKPFLAEQVVPVEFVVLAELDLEKPPAPEQDIPEPEPEELPKPEPKPEPEPQPEPTPEPEPQPEPEPIPESEPQPQPEPIPEPEPAPEPIPEPEPVPEPEPLKVEAPEPEIIENIEPEPEEVKKVVPPKPKARPKPPKRPEPKPEVVKKEEPKPKVDALTSILKNVDKLKSAQKKTTTKGKAPTTPTRQRASAAQINDIQRSLQQQMKRCWRVDAGALQADEMIVEISMQMRQDGSINSVKIVDQNRFNKDAYFRTAAENARRAVISCAPYKLPTDLYSDWQTLNLKFDPSKMFGQ